MTVIASTLSLLTKILLMVVSSDVVNGACKPASRAYQMHQGNILAFNPSPGQDHALKDTIYQVRNASSDVVCAVYCLQDDSCRSFNYCNDNLCHLKSANYSGIGLEIQLSTGCRHYGDEELQTEVKKNEGTSLCVTNTHRFRRLDLQLPMTSPIRLEFTVSLGSFVVVEFYPNGPGFVEALYLVGMYMSYTKILTRESPSQPWTEVQRTTGPNYIGVPVMVTYDNGRFEVAIQGEQDSTLTYDDTSPPQPSLFVSFYSTDEVELNFTEPCISDFEEQVID